MKDDYGYFGKGVGGYIHYMQAQNEAKNGEKKRVPRNGGSDGGGDGSLKIVLIALAILAVIYLIGKLFG